MKTTTLLVAGVVAVAAATATALSVRRVAALEAAALPAVLLLANRPAEMPKLSRDLEVMRRILLREALGVEVNNTRPTLAGITYGVARARFTTAAQSSAEAYYVAGDGAFIVLRTSDPVAPSPTDDEGTTEEAEPTLWERVVADVEGRSWPTDAQVRVKTAYDAEKVRALQSRILEQLALYGARIDQLDSSESLTIVVLGGHSNTVVQYQLAENFLQRAAAIDALADVRVADKDGVVWARPVSYPGGHATVLTVRVAMSDLIAAAEQGFGADTLRERATINAY